MPTFNGSTKIATNAFVEEFRPQQTTAGHRAGWHAINSLTATTLQLLRLSPIAKENWLSTINVFDFCG
jgi:hypothetical protein